MDNERRGRSPQEPAGGKLRLGQRFDRAIPNMVLVDVPGTAYLFIPMDINKFFDTNKAIHDLNRNIRPFIVNDGVADKVAEIHKKSPINYLMFVDIRERDPGRAEALARENRVHYTPGGEVWVSYF